MSAPFCAFIASQITMATTRFEKKKKNLALISSYFYVISLNGSYFSFIPYLINMVIGKTPLYVGPLVESITCAAEKWDKRNFTLNRAQLVLVSPMFLHNCYS